jgi:hypothetical protein
MSRFKILVEDEKKPQVVAPPVPKKTWATIANQAPIIQPIIVDTIVKANTRNGSDIMLADNYTLWYHSLTDKNWNIDSFKKMCTITNVSEFWRMINNFDKIGHRTRNLFLMKGDIYPMWEHPDNRNGGICSFRIELHNSLEIYENLCSHMVLGSLSDIPSDINGISFCPKGHTVFVKIWNRDRNNNLTKLMNKSILDKYCSLSVLYTPNKPEF